MRVALAIWNGRISPLFDVARRVLLLDVEEGRVTARTEAALTGGGDPIAREGAVAALGVDVLICGAVSRWLATRLAGRGIRLIPFVAGEVEEVIGAWLAGALPGRALAMPGCRRGREWPGGAAAPAQPEGRCDMPRGDGTGPRGAGPGTGKGRGKGRCGSGARGGSGAPGETVPAGGVGREAGSRRGGGGGRGAGSGPRGRGGAGPSAA